MRVQPESKTPLKKRCSIPPHPLPERNNNTWLVECGGEGTKFRDGWNIQFCRSPYHYVRLKIDPLSDLVTLINRRKYDFVQSDFIGSADVHIQTAGSKSNNQKCWLDTV